MQTATWRPSDDLFEPIEGHPPFMEGMTTQAVDPARNVSLLMGMYKDMLEPGRSWHNISVNLPDGRVAGVLDYPSLEIGRTIRSGSLSYEQIEPFARWRYAFAGEADYSRQDATLDPATCERRRGPLSFEIEIRCAMPPWSPPATVWADRGADASRLNLFGFYVQAHRFSGWVRDDRDNRIELQGTGWRHHVRCPPWADPILGHSFIHVLFPGGRAFGLQVAQLTSGETTGFGYVFDGEALHQCRVASFTEWNRLVARGEPVRIVLERESGETVEITGETLNNVAVSNLSARPVPADLSDPDGLLTLFGDTRWEWDGEIGYGTWERTKQVRALRS